MVVSSRATVQKRIERLNARMTSLDERIGRLMSQRVDVEEQLADEIKLAQRLGIDISNLRIA